jgi:predicted phage terminase large subunit-like protein
VVDVSTTTISRDQLVKLCAVDSELYCTTFFPNAFRQKAPLFAKKIWEPLEDPNKRLVNLICFRGSSKTTRLRAFTSKRIAYGISRTVLYVGASERDAIRSVQWIRTQVERNRLWSETFGLKPGRKWEETQLEIEHGVFGHTIWVLAAGITGSLRGINFDDYRPDLIVCDDPQTDEMAATLEQRDKVTDLILGAVKNSLAPASEEPNAKLAMAITPQHPEDISQQALKDSQWESRVFPCWTQDTLDLPVEQQISSWEERFPTPTLRDDKRSAMARNKLSIFAREMECRLLSSELAQFRPSWLNIRETPNSGPRGCFAVLGIDPVPPPSERQKAKGLQGKDFEAHYVWGRHQGTYHLLDRARNRGHEPSWTVATAMALARKWRVARIVVDAVAYQRTLKWLLEQEMKRRGIYYSVVPIDDKMAKFARITGVLSGLATAGLLWIGPEHTEFAEQFEAYGPTYGGLDDDLDASALALQDLSSPFLERVDNAGEIEFAPVEDFPLIGGRCP